MKNPFRNLIPKEDPEVKAAYEKSKREARLERAKKEGREAGLKKPKSFLDSVGEFGEKMMGSGGDLDFGGGLFGESKPKRKRKRKRKK